MNYSVEITRHNVTLSAFIASVRSACKAKGIDCSIETKEFRNPPIAYDTAYRVVDGIKHCWDNGRQYQVDGAEAPCVAETCKTKPLDYHTYVLNHDGSMYNEICEFTYWDDKTGTGYYYQANRD